jgi:hypothetical protein
MLGVVTKVISKDISKVVLKLFTYRNQACKNN